MIIMADTVFLIKIVTKDNDYGNFYNFFESKQATLGLPTPVLAEFLVRDDNFERTNFISTSNSFSQVFNFDMKSARISADIFRDLLERGYFQDKKEAKQSLKVDIQILGMTIANQIELLLTSDKEMIKIVDLLQLPIKIINFEKDGRYYGLPLFDVLIP